MTRWYNPNMEPIEAYEFCRKRAFSRWRNNRYADAEDLAHDSWLNWTEHPEIHPYVVVSNTIANWWVRNSAKKRIAQASTLVTEDDPSGTVSAVEQLAVTLETLIKCTRKPAVIHVAELLMDGYTSNEIRAENDYERTFVQNVAAKLRGCMTPVVLDSYVSTRPRDERRHKLRTRLNARRRKCRLA